MNRSKHKSPIKLSQVMDNESKSRKSPDRREARYALESLLYKLKDPCWSYKTMGLALGLLWKLLATMQGRKRHEHHEENQILESLFELWRIQTSNMQPRLYNWIIHCLIPSKETLCKNRACQGTGRAGYHIGKLTLPAMQFKLIHPEKNCRTLPGHW